MQMHSFDGNMHSPAKSAYQTKQADGNLQTKSKVLKTCYRTLNGSPSHGMQPL
jgi:hypothetical protein